MNHIPALFALPLLSTLLMTGCAATRTNPLEPNVRTGRIIAGPVAGGAQNYHSGGFRPISEPQCEMFGAGGGVGPIVGAGAEYFTSEKTGVGARLSLQQRPGDFRQELQNAYVLSAAGNDPLLQRVTMNSHVAYQLLNLDLFIKQEITSVGNARLGVVGGPSFALVAGAEQRQTLDLVEPLEARFLNEQNLPEEAGGRRLILYSGDVEQSQSLRASFMAGVQAEIGLFDNDWMLIPSISYDYAFTDVTTAENWRLNSLVAMIDFRHAF